MLLVDDCQDTRELYAEYLELSGYDVKEAGDGIVAIDEAVRVRPDVIVMDMGLPRLDGREAARRLRADGRTRAIPLVVSPATTRTATPPPTALGRIPRQAVPARERWSA